MTDQAGGLGRFLDLLKSPRAADISTLEPRPAVSLRERFSRAGAAARILLAPRWLLFHLAVLIPATGMVLLGRWQLDVSNRKHFDLQNFGYTLQWWAFTAFFLYFWIRVMQHRLHPPVSPMAGTGLVRAGNGGQVARYGTVEMVAAETAEDEQPLVYRGYVMPKATDRPVRSDGDALHGAYNDYLWQLAMSDGETPDVAVLPPGMTTTVPPARAEEPAAGPGELPEAPSA